MSSQLVVICCLVLGHVAADWRPWDGATVGFSAGLCATPGCGGSYTKAYSVQACTNVGYRLEGTTVSEPALLPWPFGQGPQPALNECSNPGELRRDLCPNILKFAGVWQPTVDGRTFGGVGDKKLIRGFGHAFTKVADGLPCGFCAAVRAKRALTDGGYNYMLVMRVDVTDDISPEVDEVTADFGKGVVRFPEADRIPYEYKIVSCETGAEAGPVDPAAPSPSPPAPRPTPAPTSAPTSAPTPALVPSTLAPSPAPSQGPAPGPAPLLPTPTPAPPAPSGACVPEDDCSKNTLCSVDWAAYCAALLSTCPTPYCKRAAQPASSPPSCVTEDDCGKNSLCSANFDPYCAALASTCPAPYCKRASSGAALPQAARAPRRLRTPAAHALQPGAGSSFVQRGDELHPRSGIWAEEAGEDVEPQQDGLPEPATPRTDL